MRDRGVDNKLWLVGGNIPASDHGELRDMGVDRVFPTRAKLDDIVKFIREKVARSPRN